MKIVKSIQDLYNSQRPFYNILKDKVDDFIKNNKNERWHYESRIKQIESFALKIEMGRFNKTEIFEDLFAGTIVVKNLEEIKVAEQFISENFELFQKRPISSDFTHKESYSFPFDDLRLYVKLKNFNTVDLAPDLYELIFEIQIKTFLQHAWSIATHDLIYKSDKIDWAKERIAYQVKAALEQAELTISSVDHLSGSSNLAKENKETQKVNNMINFLLKYWDQEDLPFDRRRLSQNILGFIDAIYLSLEELDTIIKTETEAGRGAMTRDLSPFLIVVQSVFSTYPDKILDYLQNERNRNRQKVVVTKEMTIPHLGEIVDSKILMI